MRRRQREHDDRRSALADRECGVERDDGEHVADEHDERHDHDRRHDRAHRRIRVDNGDRSVGHDDDHDRHTDDDEW
jgi:hypothetical protein